MCSAVYLCLALLFHLADCNVNADWLKVSEWINRNGGYVDPGIRADMTSHSGFTVRGIVSARALEGGRVFLNVPKKLWFTLDKFPDIHNAPLPQVPQCGFPLKEVHLNLVRVAGALAREHKKGNASFFHPYISRLPTLDDFRLFHPRFMKADVREDFAGLPMTAFAVELQKFDVKLRGCFLAWTKAPSSPVAGISVDEFELAQTQYRTRAFSTGLSTPSLVPGADFLNTDRPTSFNTYWLVKDDNFLMDMSLGGVESGTELYDEYCTTCDNTVMMSIWGLYLEGNGNPLITAANCNAETGSTRPHYHGKFSSLREASEAMLNLSDVDAARKEGRKSPRCRKEKLSLQQGPLRCSLARLAFEHCIQDWGYLGPRIPELAMVTGPRLNITEKAYLIGESYIHAVHPALLSSSKGIGTNLRKSRRSLSINTS